MTERRPAWSMIACAGAGHVDQGPVKIRKRSSPWSVREKFIVALMQFPSAPRTSRFVSPSSAGLWVSFSHMSTHVVWLDEPCAKTAEVWMWFCEKKNALSAWITLPVSPR